MVFCQYIRKEEISIRIAGPLRLSANFKLLRHFQSDHFIGHIH